MRKQDTLAGGGVPAAVLLNVKIPGARLPTEAVTV